MTSADKQMSQFQTELDKNMAAYDAMPDSWVAENKGKVALFAKGKLVDIYSNMDDAIKVGYHRYGEDHFTVEEVGAPPLVVPSVFEVEDVTSADNNDNPAN